MSNDKEIQIQITTRIKESTFKALQEYLNSTGETRTAVVDRAIIEYLEKIQMTH